MPQIQHAILSRHDLILLGLRGQAKTRILRSLVNFLDEYMPVIAGSEINDDPLKPLSKYAIDLIKEQGDDTLSNGYIEVTVMEKNLRHQILP